MTLRLIAALAAGALFGLGLFVSDMIDPARVLAFLDLASGAWDPTLGFVMAGALGPMALAWRLAGRRSRPILGSSFPGRPGAIDRPLLLGAALFGLGWGLVGFCPGPALAAAALGGPTVLGFVAAMAGGMLLAGMRRPRPAAP